MSTFCNLSKAADWISAANSYIMHAHAGVAKLVDARGLGPRGAIYGGSSPLPGTDMYPIK